MTGLEQAKAGLTARLKTLDAPPSVKLHPNAAAIYRNKVAHLQATLSALDISSEATSALRALIDKVVLMPDGDAADGLRAEL